MISATPKVVLLVAKAMASDRKRGAIAFAHLIQIINKDAPETLPEHFYAAPQVLSCRD